jgi:hypothetical protein
VLGAELLKEQPHVDQAIRVGLAAGRGLDEHVDDVGEAPRFGGLVAAPVSAAGAAAMVADGALGDAEGVGNPAIRLAALHQDSKCHEHLP